MKRVSILSVKSLVTFSILFQDEWRYLISGGTIVPDKLENPAPDWISERMWLDILTLPALPNYSSFAKEFSQLLDGFKAVFDSAEPHMYVSIHFYNKHTHSF